ncbi:MAG: hypothetical protein IPK00_10350 [Deltaproteobacteria bacterium]|nr:hypothetical protein [Deltaproteobacteria bacterium]
MKKPSTGSFEIFAERFAAASKRAGKEQYLVPYFIASHPGSGVEDMIELALYLKRHGYRPRQVQDFHPRADGHRDLHVLTASTRSRWSPSESARRLTDRQVQRALLLFAPENWTARRARLRAGRGGLDRRRPDC